MIVLDIETTGLNPFKHGIVSIGALEFENPDNQFYQEAYIDDEMEIDPESLAIIGFSEEYLRDQTRQTPFVLMKSFIDWMETIEDRTPAGLHVAGFDLQFLAAASDRLNLNWPLGHRSVDLHSAFYNYLKTNDPESFTLKNQRANIYGGLIQKYCGLDVIPRPHNALIDAKWEAECFSRLLYGKKLLPDFADRPVPSYLTN